MMEWIKSVLLIPLLGGYFVVQPELETSASPYPGDSIDDIAIWINRTDPSQSLILATLKASNQSPVKETGILVYDLSGKQIQFLPGGTPNNIDIRYTPNKPGEVIAVSHWFSGEITLHNIDHTRLRVDDKIRSTNTSGVPKLVGVCMYQPSLNGNLAYVATGKDGDIAFFQVSNIDGAHKLQSRFKLGSATEGCTVDDARQLLYVAEESRGVWKFDLSKNTLEAPELIVKTGMFEPLTSDVEGITLLATNDTDGYLIISSQGNDEYAIIDRVSYQHIANFAIVETDETRQAEKIDGTSHTDGIDLTSANLGQALPNGIFVAQDDDNTSHGETRNQNLKVVPLERILNQIELISND